MQEAQTIDQSLIDLINRGEEIMLRTRKVRRDIEMRVQKLLEAQAIEDESTLREKHDSICADQL
jgi:hypothetical protein